MMMPANMEIRRSDRKTMAIEINREMKVILRVPFWVSDETAYAYAEKNAGWIEEHLAVMKQKLEKAGAVPKLPPFTDDELHQLADKTLKMLPPRIEYYAKALGVTYGRVTVRNQVSRWGSCSSKGNLNFNCLLSLCPASAVDYVVIHELCHRREMNHSKAFWRLVESHCPDWKKQREWLKKEGSALIARLRA